MLEVRNVSKQYEGAVTTQVLTDISFEIKKGDFAVVTGKSGSGKSTLLYTMSGLEQPTSGSVIFDGMEINRLSDKEMSRLRRKSFGFVFQFYNLIPSISVFDNICLPISFERRVGAEDKGRIANIMKVVGISELSGAFPYQLSGGQQQRVAIARALAIDPDIIFADEPTGNLDDETGAVVMEVFRKLNEEFGTAIVMVTHDPDIPKNYGNVHITVQRQKIRLDRAPFED